MIAEQGRMAETAADTRGQRRRAIAPWLLLALAACVGGAFLLHSRYLSMGLYEDDYWLLRKYGTFSWAAAGQAFDPVAIHWYYRPILVLWFLLFSIIAPHNPVAMHAGSLVLDGFNAFLLGALAYRLTRTFVANGSRMVMMLPPMLAAAQLLTIRMLDEAVFWISSASTLLATLFSLAALHLWMTGREAGRTRWRVAAVVAMIIAMCSKEDAAALPLMIVIFDFAYCRQRGRTLLPIRDWAPLAIWTIVYGVLDITAYRAYAAEMSSGVLWHGTHGINVMRVCGFTYRTLVSCVYGGDPFTPITNPIIALATIVAAVTWRARHHPVVLAAAALGLLAAMPVAIASGTHVESNRFNYFPCVMGLILMSTILGRAFGSASVSTRCAGLAIAISVVLGWVRTPINDPVVQCELLSVPAAASLIIWRVMPPDRSDVRTGALFVGALSLIGAGYTLMALDDGIWLATVAVIGAVFGAALRRRTSSVLDGTATALVLHMTMPLSALLFQIALLFERKNAATR